MKTVFIDPKHCVGCRHCELACSKAHQKSALPLNSESPKPRIKIQPGVDFLTYPVRCRHCNPAPCIESCPTEALYRDPEHETVLVRDDQCISCGICAQECPFGAISFVFSPELGKDVAYKCDNCLQKVKNGGEPACVQACKTGALRYGEANELVSEARKGIVFDLTRDIQGMEPENIPANMEAFHAVCAKLAEIGPMHSSRKSI